MSVARKNAYFLPVPKRDSFTLLQRVLWPSGVKRVVWPSCYSDCSRRRRSWVQISEKYKKKFKIILNTSRPHYHKSDPTWWTDLKGFVQSLLTADQTCRRSEDESWERPLPFFYYKFWRTITNFHGQLKIKYLYGQLSMDNLCPWTIFVHGQLSAKVARPCIWNIFEINHWASKSTY